MLEQATISFNQVQRAPGERFRCFDPSHEEFLDREEARFMEQYGQNVGLAAFDLAYRPGAQPEQTCRVLAEQILYLSEGGEIEDRIRAISALLESVLIRIRFSKIGF